MFLLELIIIPVTGLNLHVFFYTICSAMAIVSHRSDLCPLMTKEKDSHQYYIFLLILVVRSLPIQELARKPDASHR